MFDEHEAAGAAGTGAVSSGRKRYSPPDIITYGTVSELTTQIGSDDGQPQGPGGQFA